MKYQASASREPAGAVERGAEPAQQGRVAELDVAGVGLGGAQRRQGGRVAGVGVFQPGGVQPGQELGGAARRAAGRAARRA